MYEAFFAKYPKPPSSIELHAAILESIQEACGDSEVPTFLRYAGIGPLGGGRLVTANPIEVGAILPHWPKYFTNDSIVFLRGGFGDLIGWSRREGIVHLDIHTGFAARFGHDLVSFLTQILTDCDYARDNLRCDLFASCVEVYGAPSVDECFGFVPAVILGGEEGVESVRRAKWHEQVAILGQLHN